MKNMTPDDINNIIKDVYKDKVREFKILTIASIIAMIWGVIGIIIIRAVVR